MDTEKRDFLTNRTLTERVQRLEQYFIHHLDMRDEGDMIPGRGTQAEFNKNQSSREHNYRKVRFDVLGGESVRDQPFEKTLVLEEILQRILMAADNAAEIAGRIEGHGNRYFGPPPMGGDEEENKRSEPRGSIEHMFVALDNLDSTLSRLSIAYSRISGV